MSSPRRAPSRRIPITLTPAQASDLRRLWAEHAAPLHAMLRRWCRHEADAADTLQDLFLRLARTPRLVLGAEDPRALLVVTARRLAIDAARRRLAAQRREEQLATSGSVTELFPDARSDADLRAAIHRAVRAVAPEQRRVFEARFLEGLTLAEIARAQNVSINTVASRFRYALDKIRTELRPYYDDMNKTHLSSSVPNPTSPATGEQPRLIRALEPKRVPSVAPGLEGLAALAPDDSLFEVQPLEIVPHELDENLPTETDTTPDPVGSKDGHDGDVLVTDEPIDSGKPDPAWLGEIDPELFICTLFPAPEAPEDEGGVAKDDFGTSDDGEVSDGSSEGDDGVVDTGEKEEPIALEDYLTVEDPVPSGEPTDDGAEGVEGEPVEHEIYTLGGDADGEGEGHEPTDGADILKDYHGFLAENPEWLAANGADGMQLQVMTSSEHVAGLELPNPGEARAFDTWYAANYLKAPESGGEVPGGEAEVPDQITGGVSGGEVTTAVPGDHGQAGEVAQPTATANQPDDVDSRDAADSDSQDEVIATGSSSDSALASATSFETQTAGIDFVTVDASASASSATGSDVLSAASGFVFTDFVSGSLAAGTEAHADVEVQALDGVEFVPATGGLTPPDAQADQVAFAQTDEQGGASLVASASAPRFTADVVVGQVAVVGGVAALATPGLAKNRTLQAVR